jgi:hypothetical protein
MSFKQCLDLGTEYRLFERRILAVASALARGLPNAHVYSSDSYMRLCRAAVGEAANDTARQVIEIGIVERREHHYCSRCDMLTDQCWCGGDEIRVDIRYEVVGELVELVKQLKEGKHCYFISFCAADSEEQALLLHEALQAAGTPGFISAENLGTGAQWRRDIAANLKACQVTFLIETASYHTRPRCQLERDYSVAAGKRVIRVLLCPHSDLHGLPPYLDEGIQYDTFVDGDGRFLLKDKLLGIALPDQPDLSVRKLGARALLDGYPEDVVRDIASQLGISDQLPSRGASAVQVRTSFLDTTYGSSVLADGFCARIDLSQKL